MITTIEAAVQSFIAENFLYGEAASLKESDSLLEAGLIDSTGILELVMFLEKTFHIQMSDAEVIPENLDSIGRIAAYVRSKTGQARNAA